MAGDSKEAERNPQNAKHRIRSELASNLKDFERNAGTHTVQEWIRRQFEKHEDILPFVGNFQALYKNVFEKHMFDTPAREMGKKRHPANSKLIAANNRSNKAIVPAQR